MTLSRIQDHPLFQAQLDLEKEMRERGLMRFRRLHEAAAQRGEWADTMVGKGVVERLMPRFVEGVREFVETERTGPGRLHSALRPLREFGDVEAACFLFIKTMMNAIAGKDEGHLSGYVVLLPFCANVGQAIHDEHRMRFFDENHGRLLKKIWQDFDRRELTRRRRKELVQKTFARMKMDWRAEGWTQSTFIHIGQKLADIFIATTGAATVENRKHYKGRGKTQLCLSLTEEFQQAILDRAERMSDLCPVWMPMIVPPRPWSNDRLFGGGYWSNDTRQYPLIKKAKRAYLQELENTDLSNVITATNDIQATGRRINKTMLEVLDHMSLRGGVSSIPDPDPIPMPPIPENYEALDEDAQMEYRKKRYLIMEANRREVSKRLSLLSTLSISKQFVQYDAIYFPHNMDSRGRLYPLPQYLNPQGPDYVKGLLDFAEGKPLDSDQAVTWLYIAAANAWGFDKADLNDRADWVVENQEMILSVAESPLDDLRWTEADEPFQFLRLALDIRGHAEAQAAGEQFVSHAVIPVDATCSGLQHFSAMLRDPVGGEATNLTPSGGRQDIYQIVADKVVEMLHQIVERDHPDYEEDEHIAMASAAIDFGISRKTTKRSVMVVPYSGTMRSCMDYVGEYYNDEIASGRVAPWDPMPKFVGFMAKLVWAAISTTVIAARHAMKWLSDMASLVCKSPSPKPVMWLTPAGLPVQQWITEERLKRLAVTWFDGSVSKFSVNRGSEDPDRRRMAQSIAPNFVHSMDAAHLQLTVTRSVNAYEQGEITSPLHWAMVHDSFGTHAADMPHLFGFLREAFVYMYEEHDVLREFELTISQVIDPSADKPNRPAFGSLDLEQVLESEFFFS